MGVPVALGSSSDVIPAPGAAAAAAAAPAPASPHAPARRPGVDGAGNGLQQPPPQQQHLKAMAGVAAPAVLPSALGGDGDLRHEPGHGLSAEGKYADPDVKELSDGNGAGAKGGEEDDEYDDGDDCAMVVADRDGDGEDDGGGGRSGGGYGQPATPAGVAAQLDDTLQHVESAGRPEDWW